MRLLLPIFFIFFCSCKSYTRKENKNRTNYPFSMSDHQKEVEKLYFKHNVSIENIAYRMDITPVDVRMILQHKIIQEKKAKQKIDNTKPNYAMSTGVAMVKLKDPIVHTDIKFKHYNRFTDDETVGPCPFKYGKYAE